MAVISELTRRGLKLAWVSLFVVACFGSAVASAQESAEESQEAESQEQESQEPESPKPLPAIGYVDTPYIPGTPWKVHDIDRPRPPIVSVAPAGQPQAAPSDAIVLFDGKDLSRWCKSGRKAGEILPAGWNVKENLLIAIH